MLKARLIGSKVSISGISTTEELLSEETELSETDSLTEELELDLEELAELLLEELAELLLEELAELEELELEELEELELEEEEPVISVIPSLFQTAVKETSLSGAWKPCPAS